MSLRMKSLLLVTLVLGCAGLGCAAVWAAEEANDGEKSVTLEQVPAPVRTAIEAEAKGAKDLKISSESDDGFTKFEVEFESEGLKKSVNLTDAGVVTERETGVSSSAVPKEVTTNLLAEHPKAEIKEVVQVVSIYYEVVCLVSGKEKEFKVFANGQEVEND